MNNRQLAQKIIFSAETWFQLNGYINSQNVRIWSHENRHEFIEEPLQPQKHSMSAAVTQRRIIGPIFFRGKL